MNFRDPGLDPEFEWLRRGHLSEEAPDALRHRVLATARATPRSMPPRPRARGWLVRSWRLGLAAAIAGSGWLGVARYVAEDGRARAVAPWKAPAHVIPSVEPSAPGGPAGGCSQPLPTSPWDPTHVDVATKISGFEAQVLDIETEGCGPLTRRYLIRMPAGDASSAPLLIVLHDRGQSPAQAQVDARWWFNDLARRERAVLVYANGALGLKGTNAQWPNAGVWQTDEGAHPAVDDFEYLRAVVDDVRRRRGLAPTGDVILAGQGSGAIMALAAAARHPERYSGVAAFLPGRPPRAGELERAATSAPGERRLRAVFIVLPEATGSRGDAAALAEQWASAFKMQPQRVRVARPRAGVERVEASLAGAIALGVLRVSAEVDPFPLPGGEDPTARAASQRRPSFFDGPGTAWAFLRQPR